MTMLQIFNSKSFKDGSLAWDRYCDSGFLNKIKNPYDEGTKDFINWRRGWNTNFKGVK